MNKRAGRKSNRHNIHQYQVTVTHKQNDQGLCNENLSFLPTMPVINSKWSVVRFHGFHKWICWWCWYENCNVPVNSMIQLSLFSQKAFKQSIRLSRRSKTAFIHLRAFVISWMTHAISDWDGNGSFSPILAVMGYCTLGNWQCQGTASHYTKFTTRNTIYRFTTKYTNYTI